MNLKSLFVAVSVALCFAAAQAQSSVALQGQVLPGANNRGGSDDNSQGVAKDLPSDARLLRDHLAEGGPSGTPSEGRGTSQTATNATKAPNAPNAAAAGGPAAAASASRTGAADELGIADAIKGVVKPLHQEVANSAVVQAVREIDATITGKRDGDGANGPAGADAGAGQGAKSRPNDALAAKLIFEQFIDEVLPWLLGFASLIALGYGAAFWFKYTMVKKAQKLKQMRHVSKSSVSKGSSSKSSSGRSKSRNSSGSLR